MKLVELRVWPIQLSVTAWCWRLQMQSWVHVFIGYWSMYKMAIKCRTLTTTTIPRAASENSFSNIIIGVVLRAKCQSEPIPFGNTRSKRIFSLQLSVFFSPVFIPIPFSSVQHTHAHSSHHVPTYHSTHTLTNCFLSMCSTYSTYALLSGIRG